MDVRPATLPDLATIQSTPVSAYSVEDGGRTIRLWIDADVDGVGPVRVFTSEADDEVTVLVVPTPPKYRMGRCDRGADPALKYADLNATLAAPLKGRRMVDAWDGATIDPLPQWMIDRRAEVPAPRLRRIGPMYASDSLTFRGEIGDARALGERARMETSDRAATRTHGPMPRSMRGPRGRTPEAEAPTDDADVFARGASLVAAIHRRLRRR